MKAYKIFSPAYKANGFHGTYYSLSLCEDNGNFIKVIGDHANGKSGKFFYGEYININQIVGIPFSDADRFISIEEVNIDENILKNWELKYKNIKELNTKWYEERNAIFGDSIYDFIYDKKGRENKENRIKYETWLKENPYIEVYPYYDFLKAIIHEN